MQLSNLSKIINKKLKIFIVIRRVRKSLSTYASMTFRDFFPIIVAFLRKKKLRMLSKFHIIYFSNG